jgi:dTDP-4-amino-4,6-dideoxygalactose transaminase
MDAVRDIAERHRLAVVEDAAHAPGAAYRGRMCGTLGSIGCFSFFANKNLPIGEGGMMLTDDDELAERLRLLRSHGMTTLTWDRHRGHASTYDVVLPGFNYRLDELRAAMGTVQLHRLPAENEGRARVVSRYREALDGRDGITMPFADLAERTPSYHLAVVLLPEGTDRDAVRGALGQARIQTSVHYPPIHTFTAYATSSSRALPRTEAIAGRILTLPLYGRMTDEQIDAVVETLRQTL